MSETTPTAVAEGHDGECDCVACELARNPTAKEET